MVQVSKPTCFLPAGDEAIGFLAVRDRMDRWTTAIEERIG
jgi:hypothetical protein